MFFLPVSAGLDGVRFLASNQNAAALQTMVNQQNALRSVAAQAAGAQLGDARAVAELDLDVLFVAAVGQLVEVRQGGGGGGYSHGQMSP